MPLISKGASRDTRGRPQEAAPLDDRRLAGGLKRGDQRAFAAVFRRHHQELYRYCRAILGDAHEAEDALQSTMVKALRALPGETREIALRPWLFRVAHNEAIGLLRARRPEVELDPEQRDLGGGIDEQAETRERLGRLVGDLGELPDRQRGALVMRELNGIGFAEIGAAFGISEAAAKQTVYEARTSLHRMAEGREMACEPVREAISSEDRRRLRSRRIRAHLRECAGCRDFEASIAQRRVDLGALAPPVALPVALAALHGALGGGAAAGGGAAVGGGAIGTVAAAKSVAAVLATIAIAGGAAEIGGLVHFGGPGGERGGDAPATGPRAPGDATRPDIARSRVSEPTPGALPSASRAAAARPSGERRENDGRGSGSGHGHRATPAHSGGPSGRSADPPGQARTPPGQAETPPGQSSTPPGHSETPPGHSETPPGHSETPPGHSETPPGHSETPPGQSQTPPGQARTPPGQTRIPPGNGGTPPGRVEAEAPATASPSPNGNAAGHSTASPSPNGNADGHSK